MNWQSNSIKVTQDNSKAPEYRWSAKTYQSSGESYNIADFWAPTREEAIHQLLSYIDRQA